MANGNVICCSGRLNQWEIKVGRGRVGGKKEMCLHLKMSHETAGALSPLELACSLKNSSTLLHVPSHLEMYLFTIIFIDFLVDL